MFDEQFLGRLADAVASKVFERLTAGQAGLVEQSASPLGRRRHIAAVRRLVASGAPGAAIVGRRHFLSKDALVAELAAQKPRSHTNEEAVTPGVDALAAKYGFERVADKAK